MCNLVVSDLLLSQETFDMYRRFLYISIWTGPRLMRDNELRLGFRLAMSTQGRKIAMVGRPPKESSTSTVRIWSVLNGKGHSRT